MTIIRGIKHATDKFITEAQGKYLPITIHHKKHCKCERCKTNKNLNKKWDENIMVQLSVRPIQLVEFVFPEDSKDIVLNSILNKDWNGKNSLMSKSRKMYYAVLRKFLGKDWKQIPEYKMDQYMPIDMNGVAVEGIGVKKDRIIDSKDMKYEGL